MPLARLLVALLFLAFSLSPIGTLAQTQAETRGCTVHKGEAKCDEAGFRQVLAAARTIALQTPPHDPAAEHQMQELAAALGKSVAPQGQLLFVLEKPSAEGIDIGPGDRTLATLRVYVHSPGAPDKLVWVEEDSGQPDTPWPTAVNALATQFRKEFRHP